MEENNKLSWQERIARIEQAPAEVQVMVAKAFIRDDIPDEDVQYLFNSESIEGLNENMEEAHVENINAEEPDGIGAGSFFIRTTKPKNNKNFITTGAGGWSTCIKGSPTDADANVLANCVGYASGRFNEIVNEARGTTGCTYKTLNCNAVNFKERAEKAGLQTGSTPRVGAIMCWGVNGGGAGHVAIVEKVNNNNSVYTSESGWGSNIAFWNQTRTNSNGRWGIGSGYYFRCFIYLPDDVQKIVDGSTTPITPTVPRDIYRDQLETNCEMNVRTGIETTSPSLGIVPKGSIYNYYAFQQGKSSVWYAITADQTQWIAGVNKNGTKYCNIYPAQPQPSPITPTVDRDIYKDQIEVKINCLRVRTGAGTDKKVLGFAPEGFYNYYETADASGYTWYRIADAQWIASNEGWTVVYPAQSKPTYKYKIGDKVVINGQLYGNADGGKPGKVVTNKVTNIIRIAEGHPYPYNTTGDLGWMAEESISPYVEPTPTPTPTPTELKIGDKVKIIGTGNGSSYGTANTAYGIGWTRQILNIWDGRPYPYQVGNNTGTTGFYKAEALQKI